jgi:hypothetical protein
MSGLLKNQEAFTSSNRKVKNLLLGWLDCFPRFFIASRMPRHAERPMSKGVSRLEIRNLPLL